ncbi:MAG: FAD binding domain-containing protein [Lachnospiraceae bacterium]
MLNVRDYVKVSSLEEAYTLNQKKANRIVGGMLWMRLGTVNFGTAIDLSGLGLDKIEEDEKEFRIGCMTPLHALELHSGLDTFTRGAVRECVRHIVGVQFRNMATVGGSIFGRFGFSDVLTLMMALDSYVELYKGGIVPMAEFAAMKRDNDILVRVIIKKTTRSVAYISERNTKTDFPVLACAVACSQDGIWRASIGARPGRAVLVLDETGILTGFEQAGQEEKKEMANSFGLYCSEQVETGSNMRASAEYRKLLAKVLVKRACLLNE